MADIDDEIAAVREAIAAGVKKVRTRTNGVEKEVEYPTFDDLRKRLEFLTGLKSGNTRRKVILAAVHPMRG